MENKINEINGIIQEGKKNIKENEEKIKKSINRLLDDAYCLVTVTNNGVLAVGEGITLLTCISVLTEQLLSNGMSKELIIEAVNSATKPKDQKIADILEKIKEMLGE